MCGRYQLTVGSDFNSRFEIENLPSIVGTTIVANPGGIYPIIIQPDDRNVLRTMKWGFGKNVFNARSETILEKSFFRLAFLKRRCLVPATGFFEWQKSINNQKIPHIFSLKDNQVFSLAGIYENNTYTVITTAPNLVVVPIHNRMPVILDKISEKLWLSNDSSNDSLLSLLRPFSPEDMEVSVFK